MTTETFPFTVSALLCCEKSNGQRVCVWAANERLKGNSFLVQWTAFLYGVSQEITVEQKVTYLITLGNCTVWDIELAAFKMITGVTLYN